MALNWWKILEALTTARRKVWQGPAFAKATRSSRIHNTFSRARKSSCPNSRIDPEVVKDLFVDNILDLFSDH